MFVQIVIIACSALGLGIATYMMLVSYGLLDPQHPLVPPFCRLDEGTCLRIVHSRNARALGPPNALLGAVYYILLIAVSLWFPTPPRILLRIVLIIAGCTVILSMYLAASLIRTRTHCVLCYTSHIINVLLMILLLFSSSE